MQLSRVDWEKKRERNSWEKKSLSEGVEEETFPFFFFALSVFGATIPAEDKVCFRPDGFLSISCIYT